MNKTQAKWEKSEYVLPSLAAIDELVSKARMHNSDNHFFIDAETGEIRSRRYVTQNETEINTPKGCYSICIPSQKSAVSNAEMIDIAKASIEIAMELWI